MLKAKCVEKYRDKNGKVVDYLLEDSSGNQQTIGAYQLKMRMIHKLIEVSNLKLTSDGRIIENKESKDKIKRKTPNGSKIHTEIAKAIILLSDTIRSMGESLEYEVEDLFRLLGLNLVPYSNDITYDKEIVFTYDTSENNYYYNMYIKAIRNGLSREPRKLMLSCIDKFADSTDTICCGLVDHNAYDINKHPIARAVSIITAYTKELVSQNKIEVQYYNKINELRNTINRIDLQACKVGNVLGNRIFEYLNSDYFGIVSNDAFTVGHVLMNNEPESNIGAYVSHAKLSRYKGFPDNSGYSIAFNTIQGTVVRARILEYGGIVKNSSYTHNNTDIHIDIDRKKDDLRTVSKRMAELLNKLAYKKLKEIEE